ADVRPARGVVLDRVRAVRRVQVRVPELRTGGRRGAEEHQGPQRGLEVRAGVHRSTLTASRNVNTRGGRGRIRLYYGRQAASVPRHMKIRNTPPGAKEKGPRQTRPGSRAAGTAFAPSDRLRPRIAPAGAAP